MIEKYCKQCRMPYFIPADIGVENIKYWGFCCDKCEEEFKKEKESNKDEVKK